MQRIRNVDFHIHTNFSDGEASYVQVIDAAKRLGLECLAITDHFDPFDERLQKFLITEEMLAGHFYGIRSYADEIGVNVLCGIETCTDFYGKLRLSDKAMRMCDIIITSPHYVEYDGVLQQGNYYDEQYWNRYMEKVLNMAGEPGDILGHSEGYLPLDGLLVPGTTTYEKRKEICRNIADRFFNNEYVCALAAALKKSGKALELHCATQTPREWVIEIMTGTGVTLSTGSDAHVLDAVGNTGWGSNMFNKYEGRFFTKFRTIDSEEEIEC